MADLKDTFVNDRIPQEELLSFLAWGWDSHSDKNGNYHYGGCIEVLFNAKHRIKKISGDTNNILVKNKIEEFKEAFSYHGITTGTRVAYSRIPINGYYRYKDVLQIFPVPDAPKKSIYQENPFLVQFSYDDSPCIGVRHYRSNNKAFEIIHLLGSILKFGVTQPSNIQTYAIMMDDEGRNEDEKKNRYVQLSYSLNSECLNSMSKDEIGFYLSPDVGDLDITNPQEYFAAFNMSAEETMTLPENIDFLLDSYFSLNDEDQESYIRSAYWLTKASEFFQLSKTISYTCLVQSIEALMNSKIPVYENCPKENCTSKIKSEKGPTAQFKDFIDRYASGIPNSIKSDFYNIRSSIAHGNKILSSDISKLIFDDNSHSERNRYHLLGNIVKVCMINWLSSKAFKTN